MAMDPQTQANILKVIFYPSMFTSHIIPMVDMARVFAMNGIDITIITTTSNAKIFQKLIDRDSERGNSIKTHVLEFPAKQLGLPIGMETINADTPPEMSSKIAEGIGILQPKIEKLFEDLEADCIVSDMFHIWTVETAAKLGIPRLVFCPSSILSRSAEYSLEQYPVYNDLESDSEKFTMVGLPHKLELTRLQVPHWLSKPDSYGPLMQMVNDSTRRSYGAVFNSFYDCEGAFEEHYKNSYGTKCWSLGPVSSWANHDAFDKVDRGKIKDEEERSVLKWLNSKKENSVVYVSFGSLTKFPSKQLVEIARALEDSGEDFIWVVRKNDDEEGNVFMEEFEKRMKEKNKGYLIWGWAPQLLILENKAIGAMVTHCGWNTVIESMNVGLPMVTWPLFAEQFFNQQVVVDVLRIGVPVGAKEWRSWNEFDGEVVKKEEISRAISLVMDNGGEEAMRMRKRAKEWRSWNEFDGEVVKKEEISRAISLVMDNGGEEAMRMRKRAKDVSDFAEKAINVGGSSHNNLIQLIQDLHSLKFQRLNGN